MNDPIVTKRFVCYPQDTLEIVNETATKVVLKIQTRNNLHGRTEQFEFELSSKQLGPLLTFGATPR